MRVLVAGGAGYVGGAITDLLATTPHEVRVFDALLYEESYRKPVEFACGDVRDGAALQPHLAWADAVIWLAALVGDPACALNPDVSVAINQEAIGHLAEGFGGRILFLSTCSVYGAQDSVLDESSPLKPLSVYAVTKLAAERRLEGKNALTFRLGTLFGLGDLFSRIRLDLVVNTLTVRAHREGVVRVYGGEQYRPLLHVRDAARAVVQGLESECVGVFNLHRENVRIIDLAERLRGHFPGLRIERTSMTFEDTRNYRVSSARAERLLGFAPQCSIDDGIAEIQQLLDTGRLKDVDNPRYTNQAFLTLHNTHVR
jgi:nucleoside-diphosphate-sugar epimerase